MRPETIEQLSVWLAGTDIAVLELSGPGCSLRLDRDGGSIKATTEASAAIPELNTSTSNCTVVAETPGIFLHHHPLHAGSPVQPKASVTEGQTLGLLQIGALLVPVRAPCAGRVEGMWVAHGTAVGFGAPLVELQASKRQQS